jgi:hypothetical protein
MENNLTATIIIMIYYMDGSDRIGIELYTSLMTFKTFSRPKKNMWVSRPYLAFGRRNPDPKLFYWIMLVSVST